MSYSKRNLHDIEDSAPQFGFSELGEAHFARGSLDAADTGLAYHVLRPGKRQAFGHVHDNAEEVHVVLSGSGRMKLDDEVIEVGPMDAIRVAPKVTRAFEAGPEGLEYLVFGPHHEKDGQLHHDWWTD
jgi:mannose-6-phosphate isomerase-like protein (cupin superfamily)